MGYRGRAGLMPAWVWSLFYSIFCSRLGGVLWLAVAAGANGVIRRNFLFCMGMGLAAAGRADGFSGCLFGEGSLKPLQKNVATLFRSADCSQAWAKGSACLVR